MSLFSIKCVRTEKVSSWWVVERIIHYSYFINSLWRQKNSNLLLEERNRSHTFSVRQNEDGDHPHPSKKMANLENGFCRCLSHPSSKIIRLKRWQTWKMASGDVFVFIQESTHRKNIQLVRKFNQLVMFYQFSVT